MLGLRYTLEDRIGAGGYSDVWRARDVVLDRAVAVKLLRTEHARHAETLARFRTEAQLASRLSHQNVARVYDFCDSDPASVPYLVMELIEGPSLDEVLASGPLSPAHAADVIAQAATGLQAAHAAGLVHRDIKPGNIMIAPGGIVKITDFGLSHTLAAAPITATGMIAGTPGYLAPERAAGARGTMASDLYSLGVLLYECLSGARPFTGTPLEVALAHRDGQFPPLPPSAPAGLAALVVALTAKDPAARPASAGDVARQAAALRDGLAGPAGAGNTTPTLVFGPDAGRAARSPQAGPADRPSARTPRYRAAAVAAVIVVVAAGLATVIAFATAGSGPVSRPRASAPAARTLVSSAGLVGQPVRLAARQLHREGFAVRVLWRRSGQQPPGRVMSVQPAGAQPPGSMITLVAALAPEMPPAAGPGQGDGPGHGHKKHPHGGGDQGNGDD
jgi:serine/threonine-protein kinase